MIAIAEHLDRACTQLERANWRMRNEWHMPPEWRCDEVALAVPSQAGLNLLVSEAQALGFKNFNRVPSDVMRRGDHDAQEFLVRFEFLRIPGTMDRIEAMTVLGGVAPLHEVAMNRAGTCVIHVSFKCADPDDYLESQLFLEGVEGFKHVAGYSNSYGAFSYWQCDDEPVYLKPRVNMRDKTSSKT